MRPVRWQCVLIVLAAVLLGGCVLAQPGTPSATWEPLPTLDGCTPVLVSNPNASGANSAFPTVNPKAPTSTSRPTRTATAVPVPTTEPSATPQPTDSPTSAPSATAVAKPTVADTVAPTNTASPEPSDTPMPDPSGTPASTVAPSATPAPTATPSAPPPAGLVEGWEGVLVALPAESAYDDYFLCEAPAGQFGIRSLVTAIEAQLVDLRASGERVRIWGVLDHSADDHNGLRITVTRLELLGD